MIFSNPVGNPIGIGLYIASVPLVGHFENTEDWKCNMVLLGVRLRTDSWVDNTLVCCAVGCELWASNEFVKMLYIVISSELI